MIEVTINEDTGTLTLRNPPGGTPWQVNEPYARHVAMVRRRIGMEKDAQAPT